MAPILSIFLQVGCCYECMDSVFSRMIVDISCLLIFSSNDVFTKDSIDMTSAKRMNQMCIIQWVYIFLILLKSPRAMLSYYTVAKTESLLPKNVGHRYQWISHEMINRQPWHLKKSKFWGPFRSYQLNRFAGLADLAQF